VKIVPLGIEHVRSVTALHVAHLPGLLSRLGASAVAAYYDGLATVPSAVSLVAVDGSNVVGVVTGSREPGAIQGEILRQHPWRVGAALAVGVVRRPASLYWLLRSGSGPQVGHFDSHAPELTYLAVAPNHRSSGVGGQLITAFGDALRAQGATRYELSVDEENSTAIAFYERRGFVRVGRYREFDQWHLRFAITLT